MNLLILYPSLFNVAAKFNRKLDRIISNKVVESVSYFHDDNSLIDDYFSEIKENIELRCAQNIDELKGITHAIVFDDGEEFRGEVQQLSTENIPHRLIKVKLTRVINISREIQYKGEKSTAEYEYIGRGSYWGNPYSMYEEGDDREEVIRKYRYDFDFEKFPHIDKKEVFKLEGKRLGCFCKPAVCHGDVLADFLNSWDDGK
tara:strand:- start:27411 stop:28016 length:606 start_codon:yes stop_codon:yes gene_type:complete